MRNRAAEREEVVARFSHKSAQLCIKNGKVRHGQLYVAGFSRTQIHTRKQLQFLARTDSRGFWQAHVNLRHLTACNRARVLDGKAELTVFVRKFGVRKGRIANAVTKGILQLLAVTVGITVADKGADFSLTLCLMALCRTEIRIRILIARERQSAHRAHPPR